jgi:hypothetical protein
MAHALLGLDNFLPGDVQPDKVDGERDLDAELLCEWTKSERK